MNSLFSFTGFSEQGSFYLKGSSDITGMELFVNGVRVDVSPILNHPGQVVRVDYSQVAVNGTNTIEVTNITPDTATVEVKIPYATVIDGTPSDVGMNEDTLKTHRRYHEDRNQIRVLRSAACRCQGRKNGNRSGVGEL